MPHLADNMQYNTLYSIVLLLSLAGMYNAAVIPRDGTGDCAVVTGDEKRSLDGERVVRYRTSFKADESLNQSRVT